jgi:hypothetical protein
MGIHRRGRAPLVIAALALAGAVWSSPASAAALRTPTQSAPSSGAAMQSLGAFAWSSVPHADHYEFMLASDSGFNSVLGGGQGEITTRSTRLTLPHSVANGTYWWRVRTVDAAGHVSRWSSGRSVKIAWTAAPSLNVVGNANTIVYPSTPATLSWTSVPLATKYLVSVSLDDRLSSLLDVGAGATAVETTATTFTIPRLLAPGRDYYWGVTPVDAEGHHGLPSTVGHFTWTWPSTTTTHPVSDFGDLTLLQPGELAAPTFSWDPVPGAVRYEVEVNAGDSSFPANSKVCCSDTVTTNSLTPVAIFENNTFNWRVRAIDANGDNGAWNVGPPFTKEFADTTPSVACLRVIDGTEADPGCANSHSGSPIVVSSPIVTWEPVPGASGYLIYCSCQTSPIYDNTPQTAISFSNDYVGAVVWPFGPNPDSLPPGPLANGGTYTITVIPRADNPSVEGTPASVTFQYQTPAPASGDTSMQPADYVRPGPGASLTHTPYFAWNPIQGATKYWVVVAKDASFTNVIDNGYTTQNSYAPSISRGTYADDNTPYYWAVFPADAGNNVLGPTNPALDHPQSFRKNSQPPNLTSPADGQALGVPEPQFIWANLPYAKHYELQVATDSNFSNLVDDVETAADSYTAERTYPASSVLYWRVRGIDTSNRSLAWSASRSFSLGLPAPTVGQNAGRGDAIPTWTWSLVPNAIGYDLSADYPDGSHSEIDNIPSPAFTPTRFYGTGTWTFRIRADFPGGTVGPWSAPFTFVRTFGEVQGAAATRTRAYVLLQWSAKAYARQYHVQVSTNVGFSQVFDDATVDGTSYAPNLTQGQYTDGGTLYWRVAAIDEGGNTSDWSPIQKLTLARRMVPTLGGSGLTVGHVARVTITVTDAKNHRVRGVTVRSGGAGSHPRAKRTNKHGVAVLFVRPTKHGAVTFRIAKTGYLPTSLSAKVG